MSSSRDLQKVLLQGWPLFAVIIAIVVDKWPEDWALIDGYRSLLRTIGTFVTFSSGFAYFVALLFMWVLNNYRPEGRSADHSHIWVWAGGTSKVRDASVRDVYEHYHGYRSWWTRIAAEWKVLRFVGLLLACLGPYLSAHALELGPQLTGSGNDGWLPVFGGVAGGLTYLCILRFWDISFSPPRERMLSADEMREGMQLMQSISNQFSDTSGLILVLCMASIVYILQPLSAAILVGYFMLSPPLQTLLEWAYMLAVFVFVAVWIGMLGLKVALD